MKKRVIATLLCAILLTYNLTLDARAAEDNPERHLDIANPLTVDQEEYLSYSNIYLLGDSILEGRGNNDVGIGDSFSAFYGVNVLGDTSTAGALLTNQQPDVTPFKTCFTQMQELSLVINEKGFPANTFVVIDGGTNDACQALPWVTYNDPSNGDQDIAQSTRIMLEFFIRATGNSPEKGYKNVPIIFILSASSVGTQYDNSIAQEPVLAEYTAYGVYTVRMQDILNIEDFSDGIHPNQTGNLKLCSAIANCVCYSREE